MISNVLTTQKSFVEGVHLKDQECVANLHKYGCVPPKGVCGSLCVSRNVDIWLLPPPITPPALLKGLLTQEPKIQCRKPCHDQMGENGTTRRYVKMLPDNMGGEKRWTNACKQEQVGSDKKCGISVSRWKTQWRKVNPNVDK